MMEFSLKDSSLFIPDESSDSDEKSPNVVTEEPSEQCLRDRVW